MAPPEILPSATTGDHELHSKDPRPTLTQWAMIWATRTETNEGKWITNPCTPHNHEFDVSSSQQKLRRLRKATRVEKAKHQRNHKQLIENGTDDLELPPDNYASLGSEDVQTRAQKRVEPVG